MKKNISLTKEQQELVESHLSIVYWSIKESIHVNANIYGFEYDDLYQEGCIWLCHAAVSYDTSQSKFSTYAKKVVRNGLISYCRQMCARQSHFCPLSVDEHGKMTAGGSLLEPSDDFKAQISAVETLQLLDSVAKDYQGVSKLGIEALELKLKGMSVSEIAALYQVPTSHVGAWISRSAQKLRKNKNFLSGIL